MHTNHPHEFVHDSAVARRWKRWSSPLQLLFGHQVRASLFAEEQSADLTEGHRGFHKEPIGFSSDVACGNDSSTKAGVANGVGETVSSCATGFSPCGGSVRRRSIEWWCGSGGWRMVVALYHFGPTAGAIAIDMFQCPNPASLCAAQRRGREWSRQGPCGQRRQQ
jgi:hypothetical protein